MASERAHDVDLRVRWVILLLLSNPSAGTHCPSATAASSMLCTYAHDKHRGLFRRVVMSQQIGIITERLAHQKQEHGANEGKDHGKHDSPCLVCAAGCGNKRSGGGHRSRRTEPMRVRSLVRGIDVITHVVTGTR